MLKPHKDDRTLWSYLESTAFHMPLINRRVCLRAVRLLSPRASFFGDCSEDGVIRIRLRRPSGRRLEPYNILDTLAHELAHLSFWDEHTSQWFGEHVRIQQYFLERKIYEDVRCLCS